MSKHKITASEMLAKFKGASPAVAKLYQTTLAKRGTTPSYFAERKPMFSPSAVIANEFRSSPTTPATPDEKFPAPLAAHVRAGLKNFHSGRAAQDALMTIRAAILSLHGEPNSDAAKYLRRRNLQPLNIAHSGTPTAGGYLTPDAVTGAVQLRLAEVGLARQLATIVPVAHGQASTPYMDDMPTVNYVDEMGEIPDSTPTWGSLNASVGKRAVMIAASNELLSDAAYAVLDMFVGAASNALGSVEDDEVVNGDGGSTYGGEVGLLASLGAAGVHTPGNGVGKSVWTGLTAVDFAAMMAKLPEKYCRASNRFVMSGAFLATIMAVIPNAISWDADGSPRLFGYRVLRTEKMPRTTAVSQVSALFGAFEDAVTMADHGIQFRATDKAPGAFENNLTLLRATSRYDLLVHNGGDGSAAGAYVGLSTAAS